MDNPIVKLENVHRYFHEAYNNNKLIIAQDLNIEIYAGELISILGASGSGKSTLLQAIGLLDNIQTGKIFIKQKRVDNLSLNQKSSIRLKQIGFVYQHHHLLADFSTMENITIPMTLAGTPRSKIKQQALELLDNFGIADKKLDMPSTLSGGEKQRVAIARALANRPDILLADEPTGNLDPQNSDNVYEQFRKYVEQYKQTTIIVTHDINLAKKTDKIFELKNGVLNPIDKSII